MNHCHFATSVGNCQGFIIAEMLLIERAKIDQFIRCNSVIAYKLQTGPYLDAWCSYLTTWSQLSVCRACVVVSLTWKLDVATLNWAELSWLATSTPANKQSTDCGRPGAQDEHCASHGSCPIWPRTALGQTRKTVIETLHAARPCTRRWGSR